MIESIKKYLSEAWRESLAKSIWDDLTPFGRVTIWLPLWLLCWLALPVLLLTAGIAIPFCWLLDRIPKAPSIFFRD